MNNKLLHEQKNNNKCPNQGIIKIKNNIEEQ